ncbi:MAG: aminopeptidase N [Pseudomonadales bacterium]|nr:aminopeptidase N [Pseudomonadales bacterium]MBO6595955.1 aminopeptidase N [Pseudomonadales bacterium]MBO6822438.1 aminopeptidase N [Pseudomonadales bacterium]
MKEGQPKAIYLKDYKVPPFLIEETNLHVDIHDDVTTVTTTLKVVKNSEAASEDQVHLVLDGSKNLATQSVAIDGRALTDNEYRVDDDELSVFEVPEQFELTTTIQIKPQDNTALEGLYKSGDMYCTQCEAEGFRNITWYLDRPDVMSKYTTTVVADKASYPILLSNGNDIDRGEEGDRHWVTWQDPFMKPAYLFALVAGDLQHIEDEFVTMSGRKVKLQIFTEPHNIDKVDYAMLSLKNSMKWDEEVYGREYDLDIFMIVAVESFNMGAMENKGLNIFNTSCVLAHPETTTDAAYQRVESVVGHEYFHNWSGNRVTCRDWFQLSLKEGFTVLRDQQFSADMGSPTVCRVNDVAVLRSAQFPEDAGPMAHPIRPDSFIEINNFYTATVYEKGAEVVGMIRTLLGPERFRVGTDLYFDRHDGQAVTTEDFVKAMEDANGVDFTQFRTWYRQAGTPVLDVTGAYDQSAKTFTLNVKQSCPATPGQDQKDPYHMPLKVGLLDEEGNDIRFPVLGLDVSSVDEASGFSAILNLTQAEQEFVFRGIESKPTPSLLRGFSAPVKLSYEYSREELRFLMSHDSDGFNRWEAGQRLALDVIQEIVGQIEAGEEVTVDEHLMAAFDANLTQALEGDKDPNLDKAMIAHMLVLPATSYLIEMSEVANVDAIHQAREAVRTAIAKKLSGLLLSVYKLNQKDVPYQAQAQQIAERALKNVALGYLMQPEDTEMVNLCVDQYESATNMTDRSAALRALVGSAAEAAQEPKEKALNDFYNRFQHEALVIDQWFAIQATCSLPGTLERVKALMEHDAFDIKVPNRMRGLVAQFAMNNIVNFHEASGGGYEFLADRVIELNGINPQMAARILSPLTRWRKYDEERQALMKEQLQRILEVEGISPDVYEIVTKSL